VLLKVDTDRHYQIIEFYQEDKNEKVVDIVPTNWQKWPVIIRGDASK